MACGWGRSLSVSRRTASSTVMSPEREAFRRRIFKDTVLPTSCSSKASSKASSEEIVLPLSSKISSPKTRPRLRLSVPLIPTKFAGPPSSTARTRAPCNCFAPTCNNNPFTVFRTCGGASMMPMYARFVCPYFTSCDATRTTVFTGIAKPTPAKAPDGLAIIVFTPMSRPRASSNGPPEFPGLMAASVWMRSRIGLPLTDCISRPKPDTMPLVNVWSRPNGFPMASTFCPTWSLVELPRSKGTSLLEPRSNFSTAKSLSGSMPAILASHVVPSARTTLARSAFKMTWKFVTM
mmetsp:Transcript_101482/g.293610  ORF Transcript_101482/g.293610 Transcript_101482/m.293610 type:complete len:292 (+) Transcript_101482:180-1055(+)